MKERITNRISSYEICQNDRTKFLYFILTANILVGSVGAILFPVTEKTSLDARAVAASEEAILTERFLGVKQRFRLSFFVLQFAVVHRVFPVAGLFIDIEIQSRGTPDGLKTRTGTLNHVTTVVTLSCHQSEPFARILVLADLAFEALFLLLLLSLHTIRAF